MMRSIRKALFPPMPEVVPPPRPEKVAERALVDALIAEHLHANALGRIFVEEKARSTTGSFLASMEDAMAIIGDRTK